MCMIPAAGDGGLKAEPGVPVELVLTGWGAAKPGGPDGAGAPPPGPAVCMFNHLVYSVSHCCGDYNRTCCSCLTHF